MGKGVERVGQNTTVYIKESLKRASSAKLTHLHPATGTNFAF